MKDKKWTTVQITREQREELEKVRVDLCVKIDRFVPFRIFFNTFLKKHLHL